MTAEAIRHAGGRACLRRAYACRALSPDSHSARPQGRLHAPGLGGPVGPVHGQAGEPGYPSPFRLADTPEKMAGIPVTEIQAIIRPCGLSPQKARAISGLSRIIVEKHGGSVPRTFGELEELPG